VPASGPDGPAAARNSVDARDELLGVARLGDPIVDSQAQATHTLGDGRLARADDHRQRRELTRHALEILPRVRAQHREIDHDCAEAHHGEPFDSNDAEQHSVLPSELVKALRQRRDEAGVGVVDRDAQRNRFSAVGAGHRAGSSMAAESKADRPRAARALGA
jgi:hypothetical protein